MEILRYPLLCWPVRKDLVAGHLVGFGWELAAPDVDKLRTDFAKELQRELMKTGELPRPPLEVAALKLCRVEVRPSYREEDGTYPAPATVMLPVAAVCGQNAHGAFTCYLPAFNTSFFYYKAGQAEALVEHSVRDELRQSRPEDVHRLLMAEEAWLDTVSLKVKELQPPKPRDARPELPTLSGVAERVPYTKAVRARLGVFPAAAWERGEEVARLVQMLTGEGANVLLVGERGVGKSAIVREAARTLHGVAEGGAKPPWFWRTSPRRLVAGARWLGDWQEILEKILAELKESRDVLWLEDVVELLATGGDGAEDSAAAFMSPALERDGLRVVGEATPREVEAMRSRLPGFVERFQVLRVEELGREEMVRVLDQAAETARKNAGVSIGRRPLELTYRLLGRFSKNERFPGKAIKFLGARVGEALLEKRAELGESELLAAFTRDTGLPEWLVRDDLPLKEGEIEAFFAGRVLGQAEAVEKVSRAVKLFKAGLNDPGKPVATLLLAGPTGVGKTATARALAACCFGSEGPLIRLDMSEFQTGAGMDRLLGSPHGDPGRMIQALRERPFSVLLLDEIEKAHPAFYDVLLTALDEGMLADAYGRTTDFRNSIVVMTTNLGARRGGSMGFQEADAVSVGHHATAIREHFRPEFLNRIDQVIEFHSLTPDAIRGIARKELLEISQRDGVRHRGLRLEFSEALVAWIAEAGFDPVYGARPLQRAIEREVVGPLSRFLLRSELPAGARLRGDVGRDGTCTWSLI